MYLKSASAVDWSSVPFPVHLATLCPLTGLRWVIQEAFACIPEPLKMVSLQSKIDLP